MAEHVPLNEKPISDRETPAGEELPETSAVSTADEKERLAAELQEVQDKYLRLYAEFENYKKRVTRDKEDLLKYGNEKLLRELLPVVDNLEMALKHADDASSGLVQGVEMTLRELKKTVRGFGLTEIEAEGKPFNPVVHEAMVQVERDDVEENTVVEEYRKGYMLQDKVIRAALVAVSKKPARGVHGKESGVEIQNKEEE